MNDFSEVMKFIIEMIEKDHTESNYLEFTVYWKQHRGYWKMVFSEDAFRAIDDKLWKEIDNFQRF